MMRSLSMAIAALRNHQVFMDVVSNNISNVNTIGYKSTRISFQEMLSQTIRGSSAPRDQLGGLNPTQLGLGMSLAGVDSLFTQGSLQDTGKVTDLAIQGEGFFVLQGEDGNNYYNRDGNFDIGVDGSLLSLATGMKVMGWQAENDGTIDTADAVGELIIPYGQSLAKSTSISELVGNLSAEATVGTTVQATVGIYDSLGIMHDVQFTFTKDAANQWSWQVASTSPDVGGITTSGTSVAFEGDGSYSTTNPDTSISITFTNGANSPSTVDLDFSEITQLEGLSDLALSNQDGLPPGSLSTFSVTSTGQITGVYSNGLTEPLGQIAMAKFLNPGGLTREGQSLYAPSANSGTAQIGLPGQDGRGMMSSGYLEMSNVELAQQFTNMIIAQRGFQANSRVITASDEMLQDLVNLKR